VSGEGTSAPQILGAPLILTALLPDDLQGWATGLRTAHFPPERNFLAAHVTLFHALPPSSEAEVRAFCAALARENPPVPARLLGIMKLGKGTALKLQSEGMIALWEELRARFHGLLSPQDEHRPRLHVTIQNKVGIEKARALQAQLGPQVDERAFVFAGLGLHSYRGGPWQHLKDWRFRG
jgi:hypothetical protein